MKPVPACLIALLFSLGSRAPAEEKWPLFDGCRWDFPPLEDQWLARRFGCPDDYCPKPLPSVACTPRGCVDDYCSKPLVCPQGSPRGCVDDSCRKGFPLWITPWFPPACCARPNDCVRSR